MGSRLIEITTEEYEHKGLLKGTQLSAYLSLDDGNNSNHNWVAFFSHNGKEFMLDEYKDFCCVPISR